MGTVRVSKPDDSVTSDASFDQFYSANFHRIMLQLYAYTADVGAAQDAVQEAFSRAWARWDRVAGYDEPAAWVRRVAMNVAVNRWRRTRAARAHARYHRPEVVAAPSPDRVAPARALRCRRRAAGLCAPPAVAASCVLAAVAVGAPSVGFAAGAFDRTPHPPVVSTAPTPSGSSTTPTPDRSVTSPGPTTTAKPVEPSTVPRAAMLREADLPAGYEYRGNDLHDADWTLAFEASVCSERRLPDTEPSGVAQRDAAFRRGPEEILLQRVYRMATPAAARSWLDGLPDRISGDCGGKRFTVVDTDFAGAGAVLIRSTSDEGESSLRLFVRQGPLITQIWHKEDPGALRELGPAVADRLCAGTTAC